MPREIACGEIEEGWRHAATNSLVRIARAMHLSDALAFADATLARGQNVIQDPPADFMSCNRCA